MSANFKFETSWGGLQVVHFKRFTFYTKTNVVFLFNKFAFQEVHQGSRLLIFDWFLKVFELSSDVVLETSKNALLLTKYNDFSN